MSQLSMFFSKVFVGAMGRGVECLMEYNKWNQKEYADDT
jgi:hypothetical protein